MDLLYHWNGRMVVYPVRNFCWRGEQNKCCEGTNASKTAFNALKWIVTVGWAIYPIGYVWGYAGGGDAEALNIIYNLADFINKIAFGVVIWVAATSPESNK